MPLNKSVYHFKVTLGTDFGEKGKQKPYRELALISSQSLSTLARAIVDSFGFDFDHCYGFYDNFKNPYDSSEMYELFTDIGEEPTEGAFGVTHIKIPKAFNKIGKKLRFLFDYGDNWQFTVELIDVKQTVSNYRYPKVLKKVGLSPEQYPEIEEEDEKEDAHEDWFHEDCSLCQKLKNGGVKMQWFPDEPIKKKKTIN